MFWFLLCKKRAKTGEIREITAFWHSDTGGITPDAGGITPDTGGITPDAGGITLTRVASACPTGAEISASELKTVTDFDS